MTQLCYIKKLAKEFGDICERLKVYGLVAEECSGFSDRNYYFIGLKGREHIDHETWVFCADDAESFIVKAEIYLKGRKHEAEEKKNE